MMVTLFFFVSGFGFSTWASRIPAIQQKLHLNEAELGAVLFALPVGLMGTLPLTNVLLSRFDSRVSCVIPMVFSMAGRSVGMSSGSAIASVSTVGYFGFLIVPPLVGSVAQAAGLRSAYAMMIGFGGLITVLVRLTLYARE